MTTAIKVHRAYRHEALMYRGPDGFVAAVEPFVREGIDLGQPVMVAVIEPRIALLRAALGPRADWVTFVDMAELGANPARIIPAWREFVEVHASQGTAIRGVGEPVWAGRRHAEILECQLHEALLNLAVAPDTPFWLVCPYDVDALEPAVDRRSAPQPPGDHRRRLSRQHQLRRRLPRRNDVRAGAARAVRPLRAPRPHRRQQPRPRRLGVIGMRPPPACPWNAHIGSARPCRRSAAAGCATPTATGWCGSGGRIPPSSAR